MFGKSDSPDITPEFIARVRRVLPGVRVLALKEKHWFELYSYCSNQDKKRLTPSFLMRGLAPILKISYANLEEALRKPASGRHPSFERHYSLPRRHRRYTHEDRVSNRLILSSSNSDESLQSPLKKLQVRVVPDLLPATPDARYSRLFKTPGLTRVRPVYENEQGRLYKKVTPESQRFTQKKISKRSIPFQIEQAKPITFVCTLPKLFENANRLRRVSQNQLAGTSCKSVFTYCAADKQTVRIEGNQYHWGHLEAHFFGGEASKNNLSAGTAASNYEALHIIELFIAKKLVSGTTSGIHVTVTPTYQKRALIADELVYSLKWQEKNAAQQMVDKEEIITIRPCSYERSTLLEEKSIAHMRSASSLSSAPLSDDENEENTPRM